jgi:hypothetical protein
MILPITVAILVGATAIAQVTVTLTPYNPPIRISNAGGSFDFNIAVTNNDSISQTFDIWTMATLPNSSQYGPIINVSDFFAPASWSANRDRSQSLPGSAPAGMYTYDAYVGVYPDEIWDEDHFQFEKIVPPDTLWTQTYGGDSWETGLCVQQTDDGGCIITGTTQSYGAGGDDVYLIKTDASGNEVWSQTFGGSDSDYGRSVQQTSGGGYIIAGYTGSYGTGSDDVYLIKTDASGNEVWSQTFGGSDQEWGMSGQQTFDGGYIIAGSTQSYGAGSWDVYLIKADASGNEVWSQTFGGSDDDMGHSVQQTSDGGYIIAGETGSYGAGGDDVYLIKTDTSGNEEWNQTFGGSGFEGGWSTRQTEDGGYVIGGLTDSYGAGGPDFYLIKTDALGSEEWSKTFGGSSNEWGTSVQQTSGGGYIIAGQTQSYGVGGDIYLIKTDASGNEVWSQTFGGSGYEHGWSVQQTSDGGYIIAGNTSSYGAGPGDVYLVRVAPETAVNRLFGIPPEVEILTAPSGYSLSQNYPNPFNPVTTISFELPRADVVRLVIYDINGREVAELVNGWRDAGAHEVTFDASNFASGVYLYRLEAGDFIASGKMVLMK